MVFKCTLIILVSSALLFFIFQIVLIFNFIPNTPKSFFPSAYDGSRAAGYLHAFLRNQTSEDSGSKVAVLIPYIGDALPSWFEMFAISAQKSHAMFDWYIFVTEAQVYKTSPNVKIIHISSEQFHYRLSLLDSTVSNSSAEYDMTELFGKLIEKHPYILVEFKPCLGFLFSDIIEGYSHWAFADMDILAGRIDAFVTRAHLNYFDIITLSFGDNNRLYMRGQMTINRNSKYVNNLWRNCSHLSNIGQRVWDYFYGSNQHKWAFQSAEGCYSRVVMSTNDLKILITTNQATDAYRASLIDRESFVIGGSILKCYEQPLNTSDFTALESFVSSKIEFSYHEMSLLEGSAERKEIFQKEGKCSYWLPPKYDVCTYFVPSNASIAYEYGRLLTHTVDEYNILGGMCREASISHFQGWKRNFFHFTSRVPPTDANNLLITEFGIIPFIICDPDNSSLNSSRDNHPCQPHRSLPTMWEVYGDVLVANRLTSNDLKEAVSNSWEVAAKIKEEQKLIFQREQNHLSKSGSKGNSTNIFSALSAEKIRKMIVNSSSSLLRGVQLLSSLERNSVKNLKESKPSLNSLSYCGAFSRDLRHCICHLYRSEIDFLFIGSEAATSVRSVPFAQRGRQGMKLPGITMLSVGWLHEYEAGILDAFLDSWNGPKILVLQTMNDIRRRVRARRQGNLIVVSVSLKRCQTGYFNSSILLDNMLYNIGLDIAATDLVLVNPSNTVYRGRGIEGLLEDYYEMDRFGHTIGYRQPGAMIFPVYTSYSKGEKSGTPYPDREAVCGKSQSSALRREMNDSRETSANQFDAVQFSAAEFTREETVMNPFLFNVSVTQHGTGFVRFPEELVGFGCYGSSILRILAGSGYTLYWAKEPFEVWQDDLICGCRDNGSHNRKEMIAWLNRFYLRCVFLRKYGIESVFSAEPFGTAFERDQLEKDD